MGVPKILIIEDMKAHYTIVRDIVDRAIKGMDPLPEVHRVWTEEEIEAVLDASRGRANVLVIFDLQIVGKGNKAWMGTYIKRLWSRPPHEVRIVVYSALSQDLERLPDRPHSKVLNKNSSTGLNPFAPLREAIEDSVRSLVDKEPSGE